MPTLSVLCVDDDTLFTDLYRQTLEAKGYAVTVANDLAEGLVAAQGSRPDIITLDVMMPEHGGLRDGFDLLERIRKSGITAHTPVVMVSAIGGADDIRHGMSLGATSYLPKQDMTPSRLIDTIEKALSAKISSDQNENPA